MAKNDHFGLQRRQLADGTNCLRRIFGENRRRKHERPAVVAERIARDEQPPLRVKVCCVPGCMTGCMNCQPATGHRRAVFRQQSGVHCMMRPTIEQRPEKASDRCSLYVR